MIDEKKITEAANAYIGYPHEVDEGTSVSLQRKAFRAGAEWLKKTLLHILLVIHFIQHKVVFNKKKYVEFYFKMESNKKDSNRRRILFNDSKRGLYL